MYCGGDKHSLIQRFRSRYIMVPSEVLVVGQPSFSEAALSPSKMRSAAFRRVFSRRQPEVVLFGSVIVLFDSVIAVWHPFVRLLREPVLPHRLIGLQVSPALFLRR